MSRGMYKSVEKGIPALVCVPTGQTVIIDGKRYRLLKLMYDLKGEYLPMASIVPR
jgi:apolipoprotein N-acyltransferase